jgi:hypothetical protein
MRKTLLRFIPKVFRRTYAGDLDLDTTIDPNNLPPVEPLMPGEQEADFSMLDSTPPEPEKKPEEQIPPIDPEPKTEPDPKAPVDAPKDTAPPVEPKAPEPPKAETKPEDEEDEDLRQIQPKRNAHPDIQNGIKALKGIVKTERREKVQLKQELEQLRQQSATVKPLDEQTQKELEELRTFRRLKDIEKDPEFTSRFDGVIKSESEALVNKLRSMKLPEDDCAKILAEGPLNSKHNERWWAENVIKPIKAAGLELTADEIKSQVRKIQSLTTERQTAIKQAAEDFQGYEAKQNERITAYWQNWSKEAEDEGKKIQAELGDWAKPKEIPANASAEQKKAIEEHNAAFDKHKTAVQEAVTKINSVDPRTITRAAVAMVALERYKQDAAAAEAKAQKAIQEAEQLRTELGKIKAAGRVSSKEAAPVTPAKNQEPSLKELGRMSAEDAFDQFQRG